MARISDETFTEIRLAFDACPLTGPEGKRLEAAIETAIEEDAAWFRGMRKERYHYLNGQWVGGPIE